MKKIFPILIFCALFHCGCAADFLRLRHVASGMKKGTISIVYYYNGFRDLKTEKEIADILTSRGYRIISGLKSSDRIIKPQRGVIYVEQIFTDKRNRTDAMNSANREGVDTVILVDSTCGGGYNQIDNCRIFAHVRSVSSDYAKAQEVIDDQRKIRVISSSVDLVTSSIKRTMTQFEYIEGIEETRKRNIEQFLSKF